MPPCLWLSVRPPLRCLNIPSCLAGGSQRSPKPPLSPDLMTAWPLTPHQSHNARFTRQERLGSLGFSPPPLLTFGGLLRLPILAPLRGPSPHNDDNGPRHPAPTVSCPLGRHPRHQCVMEKLADTDSHRLDGLFSLLSSPLFPPS